MSEFEPVLNLLTCLALTYLFVQSLHYLHVQSLCYLTIPLIVHSMVHFQKAHLLVHHYVIHLVLHLDLTNFSLLFQKGLLEDHYPLVKGYYLDLRDACVLMKIHCCPLWLLHWYISCWPLAS
jgi:hypothetical protein